MVKTILVPLFGTPGDAPLLEFALVAAGLYGAQLEGLHVRSSVSNLIAQASLMGPDIGGALVSDTLLGALEEGESTRSSAAHGGLTEFCRRHSVSLAEPGTQGLSASWHETLGDPIEAITERARFADLVVVARATTGGELSAGAIGAIMVGCGSPVLLAGATTPKTITNKIAIAWKETAEAARAVSAAMPFLAKAEEIIVLAAAEHGENAVRVAESGKCLADRLRRHGFKVRVQSLVCHKREAADTVLEAALNAGTDLLVMGGYGHSRVRELVFGGFTDQVLRAASMPVLLVH